MRRLRPPQGGRTCGFLVGLSRWSVVRPALFFFIMATPKPVVISKFGGLGTRWEVEKVPPGKETEAHNVRYIGEALMPRPGLSLALIVPSTNTVITVTSSVADGMINAPYSASFSATGGLAPYTWGVVGGSLPTGLSLNSVTGVVSGTPTVLGTSDVTVQATDVLGNVGTLEQIFDMCVNTNGYTDSLAVAPGLPRNVLSPPSDNWILTCLSGDSPYSSPIDVPSIGFGQSLSGGGGTGMKITTTQWGANPPYSLAMGIIPVILAAVTSGYYTATQKFVQYTFNSSANIQAGIGIVNFVDATGTGAAGSSNINHDCYLVDESGGHYRILRFNSGAAVSILASVGTPTQGDVVRLSCDFTNVSQVTLTLTVNSVVISTVVDANANRLTGPAWPVIAAYSMATGADHEAKLFSCGIGL